MFYALITKRPYKPAYDFDEVIAYMKRHSGTHFDPDTLNVFLKISTEVYNEIAKKPMDLLEKMVAKTIDRHFHIDLHADRFRSKYSGL